MTMYGRNALVGVTLTAAAGLSLLCGASAWAAPTRGYEVVTPNEKYANVLTADTGVLGVDQNGTTRVMSMAPGAVEGSEDSLGGTYMISTRRSDGWAVSLLAPFGYFGLLSPKPDDMAPDLRVSFVHTEAALSPEDTDALMDEYMRKDDGSFVLVTPGTTSATPPVYNGSSDDGSISLFVSKEALTANAPAGLLQPQVFAWENGTVSLVGVKPDGTVDPRGAIVGGGTAAISAIVSGAVSADGHRIVFSSPISGTGGTNRTKVYVRIDGTRTVEASASQRTVPDSRGPQNATYVTSTADTRKIIFTTTEQLVDSDVDTASDTYEYDLASGSLRRLFASTPGSFYAAASRDGARIYFTSTSALAPGQGTAGVPNLYVDDAGTTKFVATLAVGENFRLTSSRPQITARQDGGVLVFASKANLDARYLNGGKRELYRYTLATGDVSCISCAPGVTPTADATLRQPESAPGNFGIYLPDSRSMTDDGNTVFFMSPDPLVPSDVNGKGDVYQWSASDGLSLVSAGTGINASLLDDSSPDGSQVLIYTSDSLDPRDTDAGYPDLYVAKVGGGIPLLPPSTSCDGDGCQTPVQPVPFVPVSGSSGEPSNPGPAAAVPTFSVAAVTAKQRTALSQTGRLTLSVSVSEAGSLGMSATALLGKRTVKVASATRQTAGPGNASLILSLSKSARTALSSSGKLTVKVAVSFSKAPTAYEASLKLTHAKKKLKAAKKHKAAKKPAKGTKSRGGVVVRFGGRS